MQEKIKWNLNVEGNKPDKQLSEIENITKFYKFRQEGFKFNNNYFKMVYKAAYDAKHGKSLKILTL